MSNLIELDCCIVVICDNQLVYGLGIVGKDDAYYESYDGEYLLVVMVDYLVEIGLVYGIYHLNDKRLRLLTLIRFICDNLFFRRLFS